MDVLRTCNPWVMKGEIVHVSSAINVRNTARGWSICGTPRPQELGKLFCRSGAPHDFAALQYFPQTREGTSTVSPVATFQTNAFQWTRPLAPKAKRVMSLPIMM